MQQPLKVFISWSGAKSKAIAESLAEWLPQILQDKIEPFVSFIDISAGEAWLNRIRKELNNSHFGIVCLTKANLAAPWINFEAGAISKYIEYIENPDHETVVVPMAIDVDISDLIGPLQHFFAVNVDQEGMLRLVHAINKALDDGGIRKQRLEQSFKVHWAAWQPKLEEVLANTYPEPVEEPLKEVLDANPEPVYSHLARRFGIGQASVDFELDLRNPSGQILATRIVKVETFSRVNKLDTFLVSKDYEEGDKLQYTVTEVFRSLAFAMSSVCTGRKS